MKKMLSAWAVVLGSLLGAAGCGGGSAQPATAQPAQPSGGESTSASTGGAPGGGGATTSSADSESGGTGATQQESLDGL